jgi:hypothetical protein
MNEKGYVNNGLVEKVSETQFDYHYIKNDIKI